MYFPTLDVAFGRLLGLALAPTRIHEFRVNRARKEDRAWLLAMPRRECRGFGCVVEAGGDGAFVVRWNG